MNFMNFIGVSQMDFCNFLRFHENTGLFFVEKYTLQTFNADLMQWFQLIN